MVTRGRQHGYHPPPLARRHGPRGHVGRGAAAFTPALIAENTKTLFLNATWNNAGFQVCVKGDGNGTDNTYNGQGYYNWRSPAMFGWTQSLFLSTTPQTAHFAGGTVNGQIMTLAVAVPEPSSCGMALAGLAFGGFSLWRRRKRA